MVTGPLRIGLVGLGGVTRLVYVPLLARNTDLFRLAAICDLARDRVDEFGNALGIPPAARFTALEALLEAGGIDALIVLTSGSHGPTVLAAQQAGVPVLCEKPLAYTLAEADALSPAPAVQLGYMKLYDPAVTEALGRLPQLGRLRSVEVMVLHPTPGQQLRHLRLPAPAPPRGGAVAATVRDLCVPALGEPAADRFGQLYTGVALGSIVHELSLVRALAGPVTDIYHADFWPEDADPSSVEILGSTGDGARMSIRWHYLPDHPAYHEEVRIHADHGSLTLRFPTPYVLHAPTELTVTSQRGSGEEVSRVTAFDEAFERQLEAFHALLTTGAAPLAGIAEGRADIATCQQIIRRVAERRGVPVAGEAQRA